MTRVRVAAEASTRELRRAVLHPGLGPDAPLPGDDLTTAVHFAAVDDDGTAIGTCFVFPEPCPWLPDVPGARHLRQMATAEHRRGQGIGSAVLAAAVAYVRDSGSVLVWCNARQAAARFYAAHGWRRHTELFTDAEHPIPHLPMWRDLREPETPPTSS